MIRYVIIPLENMNQRKLNLSTARTIDAVRKDFDEKLGLLKFIGPIIPDDFLEYKIYFHNEISKLLQEPPWSGPSPTLLAKATKKLRSRKAKNSRAPVIPEEIA